MPHPESSPLLCSTPKHNVLPPLRKSTPPAYGVVEVDLLSSNASISSQSKPKQGGIATVPFVAIIALGVAIALIFGLTTVLKTGDSSNETILRQSAVSSSYVDLSTSLGDLRGYHRKSRQGRDYTAFYKVPYAAAPLGKLRFRDPQAPEPWEGLRDIKEVAIQCIQKEKYADDDHAVGEEDCLYGNVYVPGLDPSEHSSNLLPTMVYIHGGGFTDGNGSRYGVEYFMDEDVVVVTFQFRLGAFGFLNTDDGVIRGNQGLKDQVQMLRWVRDNIEHYGGDPERVTIFGNSGGGVSVSFLMVSPLSNGLFHRAITQSGGGLCTAVGDQIDENPRTTVEEVGRILNCPTADSQTFLDCLETKDAADIALVRTPPTKYGLTIEKTNDSGVFMPRKPHEMLDVGWVNKVPYIVGVVNAEWTGQALDLLDNVDLIQRLNANFSAVLDEAFLLEMTESQAEEMRTLYFGDKDVGNDTVKELAYLMSDRGMIHCSYAGVKMYSLYAPAYLYHITKPPYKSYIEKSHPGFPAKEMGLVTHADELQFFFLYDGYPEIPVGDQEYFEYSKYLVKLWAHFAATGDPTMDGKTWDTMDSDSENPFWFELGDTSGRTDVLRERMAFWDQFPHDALRYE